MWFTESVAEQMQSGIPPKEVKVNMAMQVMRELSAKWITEFFTTPIQIYCNHKKAGIVDAVTHLQTFEDSFVLDADL